MRLRSVLTLQELSSAACCSGNHWQGSALADSTGLFVLFSSIGSSFHWWIGFLGVPLVLVGWWGPLIWFLVVATYWSTGHAHRSSQPVDKAGDKNYNGVIICG